MLFHKNHVARPAAERFDAHCSRARVEIHKRGADNRRPQNVEQRLPQAVARRPQFLPFQAAQRPAPVFAGDYAHEETIWNHGCTQMNTDEEKSKISRQWLPGITTDNPRSLSTIAAFLNISSHSSSVFICVHPWFQSIYPTDAS